ncbi:hypothetical protein ACJX0J_012593, partial [Zea mays]
VISYNGLIKALCKEGNVDWSMALLEEMVTKGIKPNNFSYNMLINELCKAGNVCDALELSKEMLNQGLTPDIVTYNTLINGLCKVGWTHAALNLLEKLPNENVHPDIVTYNILISWHCKVIIECSGLFNTPVRIGASFTLPWFYCIDHLGWSFDDTINNPGPKTTFEVGMLAGDSWKKAFAGDDVEAEFEKSKMDVLSVKNLESEKLAFVRCWVQWTDIQQKKGLPSWMSDVYTRIKTSTVWDGNTAIHVHDIHAPLTAQTGVIFVNVFELFLSVLIHPLLNNWGRSRAGTGDHCWEVHFFHQLRR